MFFWVGIYFPFYKNDLYFKTTAALNVSTLP